MLRTTRPRFDVEGARAIAREGFGVEATRVQELPSERDQNFLLATSEGERVLKIANASESREILDFQNQALRHVKRRDPELRVPELEPKPSGDFIHEHDGPDGRHFCRLFDYLPGKPLATTSPHSPELLRSLGRFMGRLDVALEGFSHEVDGRSLYWDSRHAAEILRDGLGLVEDSEKRELLWHFFSLFEKEVAPRLDALPKGVIHNDGNDHNILVVNGEISGILDFGDMVSSALVFDLANAAAYAVLSKDEPLGVAANVVAGYHEARPLSALELEVLFPSLCTRLAMSVSISASQSKDEPDKAYLRISEEPAWEMLGRLRAICPRFGHYCFRDACGLAPVPEAGVVVDWLEAQAPEAAPVLPFDYGPTSVHTLDLSPASTELSHLDVLDDVKRFTKHIFGTMQEAEARVGVGRYDEPRLLYPFGPRTIHIGIDLFVEAGTTVRAPLAGKVHSFRVNDAPLDYGPTILLEHETDTGAPFFTLYGHLAESSLTGLEPGRAVAKGEVIATVGEYPANGNWPPHLHFQVILDLLDKEGDFPGVAAPSERRLWRSLCPDPGPLIGLEPSDVPDPEKLNRSVSAKRSAHLSETLSLSYDEPLHIVRGYRCFLYDVEARPYLDMVNNVCHVGHCHPKVVAAASRQIAVLNTNTRYLHPNIVDYAEKLTAKLPEPLEVCFFVNSGSEANDLALRLARTHTGRKDTLVLEGAYHGNLSTLIEVSPYKFDGRGGRGAPPHVHKLTMPDGYRGRYRASDPDYAASYVKDVQATIDRLVADGHAPGVLIAESILSCGGQIVLPPGYLKELYRLVREAGGVCVADEVQVGFGRVGSHFWAFEAEDVVPDIVTMGKPMGNGHPLAAVITTREIARSFQTGMEYFNTFGGNPVSCAVGLAVLDVIEEEGLEAHAAAMGEHLSSRLRELESRYPIIGDVRGRGLFLGFELVRDEDTLEPARAEASYLVNRMKEEGVLNSTDGPLENVIKLKPPLVFTKQNAELFLDRLEKVLAEDLMATG